MSTILPITRPTDGVQSINSLQISELVQSRHDSVKRTIERLVQQEVIAQPPMVEMQEYKGNARNYDIQVYVFSGEQGKLDSITVVAQLCPAFTARIVKRWQQLEQLVSANDYQTLLTQNQTLKTELLKANNDYNAIKVMYDGGLENWQIGMAVNLSRHTISKRLTHLRKLGLIDDERGKHTPSEQLVQSVNVTNTQLALEM